MAGWQARPRLPNCTSVSEIEPLDAVRAVPGEQHPVVRAEQPALMDGGQLHPVRVRLKAVFDLGRADAHIVAVVGPPERMDPVGAQGHGRGGAGRRLADRALQTDEAPLDPRLVAGLDVEAGHAGVGAHRPAVGLGGLPIPDHGLEHEPRQLVALLPQHRPDPLAVVLRDLDRRGRHDPVRGLAEPFQTRSQPRHGPVRAAGPRPITTSRNTVASHPEHAEAAPFDRRVQARRDGQRQHGPRLRRVDDAVVPEAGRAVSADAPASRTGRESAA